ncbi:protein-methionine-sulfoxide reductase catalytic subunit MsrP [Celeribacter marinus]|uniref:Protein-methionine-sulfoxide reductase catalytic subunit MsrP n=1 Tax=Celeribacter marinus TaxID=1397108 RepID=A0A0N9ZJR8_9RHOB|nr:protein-methionine-sulfoxide reductase catalytic subunit MsrP [Celeribacter marinus]ALI55921.1 putative sulfite oxidase subunit YedY [Celeribacter marinus]SFK88633.1 sulfoxide reductase catalytic subunit YedY [Celeribacter marinus]
MKLKTALKYSDVTSEHTYMNRRALLAGMVGAGVLGATGARAQDKPEFKINGFDTTETPNTFEEITTYNNFYEFGTDKGDPAKYASALTTDPWSVEIDGLVERPGSYGLGDILSKMDIDERIYRFRCVEAWSMVIPWNGFELRQLLQLAGIQSKAKYVRFETLYRPEEMRGQQRPLLDWPYVEGLRLDEAMHPLTLMATGLYGKELPNQNGAPLRLVVPWKYGFKSIKSVVKITLTDKQPVNTWKAINHREYGFYSNVNPEVSHPRWTQSSERRIGGGVFAKRIETVKFNGYEEQVADLYKGMDLTVQY